MNEDDLAKRLRDVVRMHVLRNDNYTSPSTTITLPHRVDVRRAAAAIDAAATLTEVAALRHGPEGEAT